MPKYTRGIIIRAIVVGGINGVGPDRTDSVVGPIEETVLENESAATCRMGTEGGRR